MCSRAEKRELELAPFQVAHAEKPPQEAHGAAGGRKGQNQPVCWRQPFQATRLLGGETS